LKGKSAEKSNYVFDFPALFTFVVRDISEQLTTWRRGRECETETENSL
jgi:hypothetical protein